MQRNHVFSIGEYYHLYSRGVDKRSIFIDDHDKNRFVKTLFVSNGRTPFVFREIGDKNLSDIKMGEKIVAIGSYCLMPNHFHIVVKEITEDGISEFMKKLLTGYSMYFNKRHNRTGRLFEGVFKAEHVDSDEYLKYIFSYIHLNPVKLVQSDWKEIGIKNKKLAKQYLNSYRYSSYLDYLGQNREEKLILAKDAFPEYFTDVEEMENEVGDWLDFNKDNQV